MTRDQPPAGNLTGSILISHPSLMDLNFHKTVVFLSHHSSEDGAVGLILNRPEGVALGDGGLLLPVVNALRDVPVFQGGPVATDDVLLASIQWREHPAAVAFRGFGVLTPDIEVPPECMNGLRAFRGYSGWSRGQLESEIAERAWIVTQPVRSLIEISDSASVWSDFLRSLDPVFRLYADAPDDPSRN
jgi:putative transcriptional regulator